MNRVIFDMVLNILGFRIVRENSRFRVCLFFVKIFVMGLYRLVYGNFYLIIGLIFDVGKLIVIEVV